MESMQGSWVLTALMISIDIMMSLVLDAFTGSWGTDGMTMCHYDQHSLSMQLYGHVTFYLEANPTYQVVSERDNPLWRRPRGCPQKSWLWQVDEFCWELLGIGRKPAWTLVRHDYQKGHHRIGKVLCPLPCASISDPLILILILYCTNACFH